MRLICVRCALALFIIQSSIIFGNAQEKREPISDKELMALVAGNSLSENVAHEVESRGLAFRPNDQYRSLLTEAGGDARVLKTLRNAGASEVPANEGIEQTGQLLMHLSAAGKFLRNKQYEEAGKDLTAALQSGGGPETGFVMGELLCDQEQWGEAAVIYEEVLRQSPEFTEAHTKLSYILHHLGDPEGALREAKSALTEYPDNAEAHRYAGVAYDDLQKSAAAEQEYREALRIKPDYAVVHYDLGILFYDRKNWDESITEYKKSIVLDPTDERAHYNLGNVYSERGDTDSAIREYREAKRLNPKMLWARQNLGEALIDRNMNAEAVVEFRELEEIAPDFAMCHSCLGGALFQTGELTGAEKEYRRAIEVDPSDATPHLGIGEIREEQKDFDAALEEYREAERLDDTSSNAHRDAGRMLLAKKDVAGAVKELKYAENLKPSDVDVHDLYGQALAGSGDISGAIAEFKQAVAIDPKQARFRLDLASAFEKNGDWVASMDQYRQAAFTDHSPGMQDKYKMAQSRLNQHIASLRASGKSLEAKALNNSIRATNAEPGISERLDAAMKAGWDAVGANHIDEAEAHYKEAVELAKKLQPHDQRLATSLIRLSGIYSFKKDFANTESALQQALAANVELYGAESPMTTDPLQALGMYALYEKDYKSALDFFLRAVDVNEKTFGEANEKVADCLRFVAHVYVAQGAYDQAETYLLRAVHINEQIFGMNQSTFSGLPLWELCNLYDTWNKPDKAEPRYREMLVNLENQYGTDSPVLISSLAGEARALHQLGRLEEAEKVDTRLQSIRAAIGQTDGQQPQPHP